MRLDKFLSHQLGLSRANVNKELKRGRVISEDKIIKSGAYVLAEQQQVYYRGRRLVVNSSSRYIMLHKPLGYVCSTVNETYPSILNLVPEPNALKLHMAGRLDVNTSGLVLLTDDGQWSHRITTPKHHYQKEYWVTLSTPITEFMQQQFAEGILLKGENRVTKPAQLIANDAYHGRVLLYEGRYHQVRRMFAATGSYVERLQRVRIGKLCLDIGEGQYRALTEIEIDLFNPNLKKE